MYQLLQLAMDDTDLEESSALDGSLLDVSSVEEVETATNKQFVCGICNKKLTAFVVP